MQTQRLYSTSEAAETLDVPASAIATWASRGRVFPAGLLRGRGRTGTAPLYRLDELQPLAEAYHRKKATRRPQRTC